MNNAATSSVTGENAALPIAHIDAQDEPFILPIREYLETHGVQVFVNQSHHAEMTYHIAVGEGDFVKHIFSRARTQYAKRLGIIIGFQGKEGEIRGDDAKIVLLDLTQLSDMLVLDVFEFFFTSGKKVLDLRTQVNARIVHEVPVGEQAPKQRLSEETPRSSHLRATAPTENDTKRIGSIIADMYGESAVPTVQRIHEEKRRRRKKRRQWGIGILIGIGMVVIPVVWYLVSLTVGSVLLGMSARALISGNVSSVQWETSVAQYWIRQGNFVLHVVGLPLTWVGQEPVVRGQERVLSFLSDATDAQKNVRSMIKLGQGVAVGLLNQVDLTSTGTTPAADITSLRTSLASVQNTLGLAQAELTLLLQDKTFPFTIPVVSRVGGRAISELTTLRESAATTDELLSLFVQLAGFKEPRRYLILLQNSAELRPTGGFIGSVAVVTFEDGRMTDLQVQDVYTFDGQLKGHVEPPQPVRELLGQEHWYLRDSNWDPDFAASAERAAWFYQKEMGNTVDGVFAVNTPFVVDVLKATGPIDLPDYDDRITADNFYGKTLYYTQNNFFPGSTQKQDFLSALTRAMMTKLTTGKSTNIPILFHAIATALTGHDLLMMFHTPELQSLVEHYGWAGRVPSTLGCTGVDPQACLFDPLILVESNMGVNKVNYFITRTMTRQVTIDANGVLHEVATIAIRNANTPTNAGGQGLVYRLYLRVVLPFGSSVADVTLDGVPIISRGTATVPPLPYIEKTDGGNGMFTVGIALEVPAGTEKRLQIAYTPAGMLTFGTSGSVVDIFTSKQPGMSDTSMHMIVQYPLGWTAGVEESNSTIGYSGDFIAKQGQLEYNMVLDRDRLTRIRFTK